MRNDETSSPRPLPHNPVLRNIALLLLVLFAAAAGLAAPSVRLKAVDFKDGDVRIQLNAPVTWHTTAWRSANRFIVEVPATGGGDRRTTLPVNSGHLKTIRWTQFTPDTVRVVLDLTDAQTPAVLTTPPTDVIEIRVANPRRSNRTAAQTLKQASPPPVDKPAIDEPSDPDASPSGRKDPDAPGVRVNPVTPRTSGPAHVTDITLERNDDGLPQQIIVKLDRPIDVKPEWRANHLVLSLPDAAPGEEHILPVNDEVCLRAYAAREAGHAAVVVDFTRRVQYDIAKLDDGLGFSLKLDLSNPAPVEQPEPSADSRNQ